METMTDIFNTFGALLASVLPTSPFQEYIQAFVPPDWLGYLNWFIPVSSILGIFAAWLTAVALFYLYSIIMRWVRAID